jgi:sugar/nucleoside kinase (ribokinase family)
VACVGNIILDIVHTIPWWPQKSDVVQITAQTTGLGGGAANVACDLAAMEVPYAVVPVGLIGAGALGDEVLRLFGDAGVPVDLISRTAKATTAQTHVMNVHGDSRTLFFHAGASALMTAGHVDLDSLAAAGCRVFYYGYLHLLAGMDRIESDGPTGAARVLAAARERGMMTCLGLVSSQSPDYARVVAATLAQVDVLFLNEVEAARASGLPVSGEADVDGMIAAARALKEMGVRRAIVIHSPAQVVWLEENEPLALHPETYPAGAHREFVAGVIHGLHEGWTPQRCTELGFRAAAHRLAG